MRKLSLLLSVALCVALEAAVAQAQSPVSLDDAIFSAIRYLNATVPSRSKVAFIHFGSSATLQEYLLENFTNKLKPNPQLGVMERRNSSATIEQFNLPATGDLSDSIARDVGKRLNVDVVVTGSVTLKDSVYSFRIQAVAVQSNRIYWSYVYTLKPDQTFLTLFNEGVPPVAAAPAAPVPTVVPEPAPATSAPLLNKRYEVVNQSLSWTDAVIEAERRGGYLAVITSAQEQNTIANMLATYGGDKKAYWLGGYRDTNNRFVWITNEAMNYTNWAPGEPNSTIGEQDKISMVRLPYRQSVSLGQWDDEANDLRGSGPGSNGFIIEWD
jgi:TolB-like protein